MSMKKLFLTVILMVLFQQLTHAQDTLKHITSGCIGHVIATESDSCPKGINFRYFEDTLEIYGTIWANCCGEHFVQIIRSGDTIHITTFDTGQLCNCSCLFCFDIKLPATTNDTLVEINGVMYNAKKINSIKYSEIDNRLIELYPNPVENILYLKVPAYFKINNIGITDITGRLIKEIWGKSNLIDIKNLESGIYFINFELEDHQPITKKIIKK
jgi:hypothetical protein